MSRQHTLRSESASGSAAKRGAGMALDREDPIIRTPRKAQGEVGSSSEQAARVGDDG